MNSKFEKGKRSAKKTASGPMEKAARQKSKKRVSSRSSEDEFFDSDLFDEKPKSKRKSVKETNEEDIFFDDDLGGMDFLDEEEDSYYDEDDDLY